MELKFAMLADNVIESREGKLVIVGIFDKIMATALPAQRPAAFVARFEAATTEGREHTAQVHLVDADGQPVLPASPQLPLNMVPTGTGRPLRGQIIVRFGQLTLPAFGDYSFHILIDGRLMAMIPFWLERYPAPPATNEPG